MVPKVLEPLKFYCIWNKLQFKPKYFFFNYFIAVPLSVTHATLVDTKLMGYNIPGKSFVIPNLYSVSLDPNHWEEPTKFNPDRFIDSTGKIIKKDAFMPFSIGNYGKVQ